MLHALLLCHTKFLVSMWNGLAGDDHFPAWLLPVPKRDRQERLSPICPQHVPDATLNETVQSLQHYNPLRQQGPSLAQRVTMLPNRAR